MRFNDSYTCDNLHNKTLKEEEVLVQQDVSKWMLYTYYFQSIPPLVMTFFYGIISDRYNRKVVMATPMMAAALETSVYILMAAKPSIPLPMIIVGKLISGLGLTLT